MQYRLAIVTTHPIQYNAPWFALLAKEKGVELKVFYTWSQRKEDLYDDKFGKVVKWDVPLLEGYEYSFIENISSKPGNRSFQGIRCPELINEVQDWGASHLLVFGWNFHAHLAVMRHFKGKIPVLFRGDSTLLAEKGGIKSFLRRMVLRWVYRYVDHALYVGNSNKEYFLKHGLKQKQLVYAPHAVDNERFGSKTETLDQQVEAYRKTLGIAEEDQIILFVGKLEAIKNPFLLLEAYHILSEKYSIPGNLKVLFVGSGVLDEELRSASKDNPDLLFLPFQNQTMMPAVYRLGTVLCLPSLSETWGLVVNEAMASGTRCVLSDKCGCAADLGALKGNSVFLSNNADDLAIKLYESLFENTHPLKEFTAQWSYNSIVEGCLKILSE